MSANAKSLKKDGRQNMMTHTPMENWPEPEPATPLNHLMPKVCFGKTTQVQLRGRGLLNGGSHRQTPLET